MMKLREAKLESVKLNLATRLHESSITNSAKFAIQLEYLDVSFDLRVYSCACKNIVFLYVMQFCT